MKINYLFSGIDKEKGFSEKQAEYLKKDIKNDMIITFIASYFDNFERSDSQFKTTIEWFKNIDINFKEAYLIDDRVSKDEAKEYIEKSEVVYLMGGSPFVEMENIKKYDLVELLRLRSGITIGISAGSMNQASKVVYKDENNNKEVISIVYEGIGLTDISIYPHLDFKNIDFLKEVFEVSKEKDIIALPNESFIRIENGNVEYIGEYYPVLNETIDYK